MSDDRADTEKGARRIALRFLRSFCPEHLFEELSGDLVQRYDRDLRLIGRRQAGLRLFWNTVRFFRPDIIMKRRFSPKLNFLDMHQHFLKVFFRTSVRNGAYTFINISGLALGLASALFILLWNIDEVSFDQFHADKNRIYKVMGNHTFPDKVFTDDAASGRLGPALKELPEIEETCRHVDFGTRLLFTYGDRSIYEFGAYADASLFSMFTIPLVSGVRSNPLPDNNSIAISQTLAVKYFAGEDPIGKIFRIDNKIDAKVTAVFQDIPENSTLHFEFVLPYALYAKGDQYNEEWAAWSGGSTYVRVRKDADIGALTEKIDAAVTKPKIWPRWGKNVALFLFSMNDWRLRDQFENGKQTGGRIFYVEAFGVVAVFILLIACFNFMNLTTARSLTRSKEIGVRKISGAGRKSLTWQFMGESMLTSFASLLISLIAVYLLLPAFNEMTAKHLVLDFGDTDLWMAIVGTTVFTGLVAGSYPAIFLSSVEAIQVLKGKTSRITGGGVRKSLVVFQFALSVILIISATVVYRQISFMRSKNLGFDRENAFYLRMNDALRKNFEEFKRQALSDPSVRFVSRSDDNPMDVFGGLVLDDTAWPGKTKEDNLIFQFLQCDADLLPALGFTFVEGRNFLPGAPADSANYIITEEAARVMRLKDPVGQYLNGPTKGHIVGVIKDFHSTGLQKPITPVIIAMNPSVARRLFVSYEKGQLEAALTHIGKVYRKISPDFPMEYKFIDEPFETQYQNEILIGKLATCFMVIAIFISCLGLFGLSSFTSARRAKEISIRKVLGGSVSGMVILLCRDFVLLVGVALLVGLPVAWLLGEQFLKTFAFHFDLDLSVFVATIACMLVVALATVSFQALKAAIANPVNALKNE